MNDFSLRARLSTNAPLAALALGYAPTEIEKINGHQIDDSTITTNVKAALRAAADAGGFEVNVEIYKGAVELSGFAHSQAERIRATTVASDVKGVQSVQNDIRLKY